MTELQVSLTDTEWPTVDVERDLVEQAKRDRNAFGVLYRRHYGPIAGYVHRRVGRSHVTEDLVAETFLTAMEFLPRYRHRGVPFRAWLYRIATNAVNRWARRERSRLASQDSHRLGMARHNGVYHLDPHRGGPASQARPGNGYDYSSPDADAGKESLQVDAERARHAMLLLPPKQQAVLALHYLEGLSVQEVAGIVGCRVGTVKSRLARAREALRARLLPRSDDDVE